MNAEPLLLPDVGPSVLAAAVRAGLMIGGLIAVAIAWIYWQRKSRRVHRSMKIEDRLALNRSSSIVLMQVDGERMLVGVSGEGIRLLRTLRGPNRSFSSVLAGVSAGGDATELDPDVGARCDTTETSATPGHSNRTDPYLAWTGTEANS